MTGLHKLLIAIAEGGVAYLIATIVISCGGGDGLIPTAPTSVTATTVTSVAVSASATSLTVGATAMVTAVAAGTTTIIGTFGGKGDWVGIMVTAPDADTILARCPTPSEVATSDLDLSLVFESDPTVGKIVCSAAQSSRDLTLLKGQVYRVLTIMRQLEFDAPLPWTSKSLYGWMVSTINGIRFRGDITYSFCCNPADTINIKASPTLAALQFPSDFRSVGTLMVLFVHEARHNNGKPHTCGANDNTIGELGAWGVQYDTDLFLGSHSDPAFITPAMQSSFAQHAQSICSSRFCQNSCP